MRAPGVTKLLQVHDTVADGVIGDNRIVDQSEHVRDSKRCNAKVSRALSEQHICMRVALQMTLCHDSPTARALAGLLSPRLHAQVGWRHAAAAVKAGSDASELT